MYDVPQAIENLQTVFSDTGVILAAVLSAIITGLVALMGLGFGIQRLARYITGNAPGTFGYNSAMGSGASYYHPRKNTTNASGGKNLLA